MWEFFAGSLLEIFYSFEYVYRLPIAENEKARNDEDKRQNWIKQFAFNQNIIKRIQIVNLVWKILILKLE